MCSSCDYVEREYSNGVEWFVHYIIKYLNKIQVFDELYREKMGNSMRNELFI